MKRVIVFVIIISILAVSFVAVDNPLFQTPKNWNPPVYDFSKNPLTAEKIEIGRALFYDPILSKDSSISCNSCHSQFTAFAHVDHALSHGINGRIGKRNAPSLANMAWQKVFMWDGAVNHLDMQPLAPISNVDEMDDNIADVLRKLNESKLYRSLFYKGFGDSVITSEYFLKSMSQFMITLVSCNAKYDSVMRGEAVFTMQETNGYGLFKKNCATCHTEPLFSNYEFKNNGLLMDSSLNDVGRMKLTDDANDFMKFKVPTLRNLEYNYPYMHDGRFRKLSDVIKHYTSAIQKNKNISKELEQPIVLSSNEKVDLIAFLLTLTDRSFLFNPKYSYPKNTFAK